MTDAAPSNDPGDRYQRHKQRTAAAQAEASRAGRDIGEIPPIEDPARKKAAEASFRAFCETYLPEKFGLGWSEDHLLAIGRIEDAVLRGGLFALAMPRGSGKTTLTETAVLWAILFGHRQFVVLIGADKEHAVAMLDNVKVEMETNDLLMADFPEVCHAVRCLEAIAQKSKGQLHRGQQTYIRWKTDEIVLPTIGGSQASGCRVRVRGITGRIRGMKATLADGRSIRPSLAIIDDPQTEESANSEAQCTKRMRVLTGAILGLAGPGESIAGIMPCTVIVPGDMADQILDQEKYPQWRGLRTKLVYTWPTREDLWQEYLRIRAESLRQGNGGAEATEFYRQHLGEMNLGGKAAWEARHAQDELSAIQHAYNLKQDLGDAAFDAEYQNTPQRDGTDVEELTPEQICAKVNRVPRGTVPDGATALVAMIDVHQKLLYWMVAAFARDFTGHVVDYRAWPEQRKAYFRLTEARPTIAGKFPGAGLEGSIYAALDALVGELMEREWFREDGGPMRIERILIDANWGQTTDTVKDFCRRSKHAAILLPSHGRAIAATQAPMEEWPKRQGEVLGFHWVLRHGKGKRIGRHVLVDVNYWKSFLHERLAMAVGDRGGMTLFGADPKLHLMLAHHLRAEVRKRKPVPGRVVDEWSLPPARPDNHLLDLAVGCLVGASMQGCQIAIPAGASQRPAAPKAKRRRVSYLN